MPSLRDSLVHLQYPKISVLGFPMPSLWDSGYIVPRGTIWSLQSNLVSCGQFCPSGRWI